MGTICKTLRTPNSPLLNRSTNEQNVKQEKEVYLIKNKQPILDWPATQPVGDPLPDMTLLHGVKGRLMIVVHIH